MLQECWSYSGINIIEAGEKGSEYGNQTTDVEVPRII